MNRTFARALAALGAALTIPVVVASPAAASPEDGQGCAGLPAIPQTYVCVISATPQNAVPTTTTTTIPVTVPRVCYVADCTGPTVVNVPVPGVTPGTGAVAVLWYQGVYYPIAIGQVPSLTLLQPYVQLVTDVAGIAVGIAQPWIAYAESWIAYAEGIVNDPPTTSEIRNLVIENTIGYETYDAIVDFVQYCRTYGVDYCLGFQLQ